MTTKMPVVIPVIGATVGGLAVLSYLLRKRIESKFGYHDEKDEEDVRGKIVVITGASAGLGKEAAYELANRGAVVVMACRDAGRAQVAIEDIRKRTKDGELVFMELDLASLQSVRDFAESFSKQYEKIDILVNNAGVFIPIAKQMKTADGFEINFGTNHLGHFLLTNLLLEKLKAAAPSRVVVVASTLSQRGKLDFDDLMLQKADQKDKFIAYSNSKLANILFARELAKRLDGTGVNTYALCPGWVKTELARYSDLTWKTYLMIVPAAFMFMRSCHQGVQTILHCALSRKVATETGKLYRNCDHWASTSTLNDDLARKLWETSESLVGLKGKE